MSLSDLWPLYGLSLRTTRLELRLPREPDLASLARLAGSGVHGPDERPFLTPWTDGSPTDRARFVLQEHWRRLGTWQAQAWQLGFGVLLDGEPIGLVTVQARDFRIVREVYTSSWLGIPHQRRGFGTEARIALLTLAFEHLGANAALSDVFQDNHASQGVSRKLGYRADGICVDARDGEAVVTDRLRLTREGWSDQARPPVTVLGLDACLPMFGL